jgi:hypothetical protein
MKGHATACPFLFNRAVVSGQSYFQLSPVLPAVLGQS